MPRRKISQVEALRLQKRVADLEARDRSNRMAWASEWVGGVNIAAAKWEPGDRVPVAIRTARRLKHAVVATVGEDGSVQFHALAAWED